MDTQTVSRNVGKTAFAASLAAVTALAFSALGVAQAQNLPVLKGKTAIAATPLTLTKIGSFKPTKGTQFNSPTAQQVTGKFVASPDEDLQFPGKDNINEGDNGRSGGKLTQRAAPGQMDLTLTQTLLRSAAIIQPNRHVMNGQRMSRKEFDAAVQARHPFKGDKAGAAAAIQDKLGAIGVSGSGSSGQVGVASTPFVYAKPGLANYEAGYWYPMDCSLAVGKLGAVEPGNSAVKIYTKAGNNLSVYSLIDANTFCNYPFYTNGYLTAAFDPRAVYDAKKDRFVVTFEMFPYLDGNGDFKQDEVFAVSDTGDPTGTWSLYILAVEQLTGDDPANQPFWDYPQLGLDDNWVYVTANVFGSFVANTVVALDKASLYGGAGLYGYYVPYQEFDITPPIVRSGGTYGISYFVSNEPGTVGGTPGTSPINTYIGYTFFGGFYLFGPYPVDVPYYDYPSAATQPGGYPLDSLDSRFQDKVFQYGDSLYLAHTVDLVGFPVVRAYQLDAWQGTLKKFTQAYSSLTSGDNNPSMAVNDKGTAVLNWSSTDTGSKTSPKKYQNTKVAVFDWGKQWPYHAAGTQVPGSEQGGPWAFGRNGDYSMTMIDPSNQGVAWGVNQTTPFSYYYLQNYIFGIKIKN